LPLKDAEEIKVIIKAGQPSDKLLEISHFLALGQIELARNNYLKAIDYFNVAVEIQDDLPYREPEFWYYPTRQSLGHALLLNKDFEAAVEVFNKDLENYPRNGWSFYGLHKAHQSLENKNQSQAALDKFKEIWQFSDVELKSSVIY
jgi:tetratricopeptide (TPR) repeat protein